MEFVQLIEKIDLDDGVWMTFWAVEEGVRLSMEIHNPTRRYELGEVYLLDRGGHFENSALRSDFGVNEIEKFDLPLPRPTGFIRGIVSKLRPRGGLSTARVADTGGSPVTLVENNARYVS